MNSAKRGCLRLNYIKGVEQAGGAPLLLPNSPDVENARSAAGVADGLLLTGGWDINPALYGQQRHATVTTIDDVRDAVELAAIEVALRRRIPIFAICRGLQILNVAMGGSLIQDIPTWSKALPESARMAHRAAQHEIAIEPASVLGSLLGGRAMVNSRHHQAIDRLADGLTVTARSADGIVEAVESKDGQPILAMQCHPEDLWQANAMFLKPFQWLIQQASGMSDLREPRIR